MIKLAEISTTAPADISKKEIRKESEAIYREIGELSRVFEASKKHALLVVLQGMDTSGKDGVTRKVFSRVSPSVVCAHSFKKPTPEEMDHDFLWRVHKHVPAKGKMMVFNRSHYEDVLIQRVHKWIDEERVEKRIEAINNFENLLVFDNNTIILKFYLHLSRKKQKEKLEERLSLLRKNWKHNPDDWKEAELWDKYMVAYEDVINKSEIPWHIVPSDNRWYRNYVVAKTVLQALKNMDLHYPPLKK